MKTRTCPLTPRTFDLLAALVESAGDVLDKEVLLQRVWGDTIVEEANLSHQIHFLRLQFPGIRRYTTRVSKENGAIEVRLDFRIRSD